jgi:hypothetical protein
MSLVRRLRTESIKYESRNILEPLVDYLRKIKNVRKSIEKYKGSCFLNIDKGFKRNYLSYEERLNPIGIKYLYFKIWIKYTGIAKEKYKEDLPYYINKA